MSYLEYLVSNGMSYNMLANHVSACRVKCDMNGLPFAMWDHPNVRYFWQLVKINIAVTKRNIIVFLCFTIRRVIVGIQELLHLRVILLHIYY